MTATISHQVTHIAAVIGSAVREGGSEGGSAEGSAEGSAGGSAEGADSHSLQRFPQRSSQRGDGGRGRGRDEGLDGGRGWSLVEPTAAAEEAWVQLCADTYVEEKRSGEERKGAEKPVPGVFVVLYGARGAVVCTARVADAPSSSLSFFLRYTGSVWTRCSSWYNKKSQGGGEEGVVEGFVGRFDQYCASLGDAREPGGGLQFM